MTGLIFDIKEFGLHDGSGLRTTVFMKGCPLRCTWCHNPEGQSFSPELLRSRKCTGCGLCRRPCNHPECRGLGGCLHICPTGALSLAGKEYTPRELANRLNRQKDFLALGGVTFSGGEPLAQAEFLLETMELLPGVSFAAETCGVCDPELFAKVTDRLDNVYIDMKLRDSSMHKKWTGLSNELILQNISTLLNRNRPFTVRIPMIPGVTDSQENLAQTALFLASGAGRVRVELLPYNRLTGAKYASVGRVYSPGFDEKAPAHPDITSFTSLGLEAVIC